MKPLLPYSLLLAIAISPLALAADYGQILNSSDPYTDVVKVVASTAVDTGAVEVNTDGVSTILQGKVTVTNEGAYGNGLYLRTGSGIVSYIDINEALSDVNIYTLGGWGGNGIYHNANNANNSSKITIDAGVYDLNVGKANTSSDMGTGVWALSGGNISITAKNVTIAQAFGMSVFGTSSIINVTAEKVTVKAEWRGVIANERGVINITGNLDTTTTTTSPDGIGVYAGSLSAITVDGHTTVLGDAQYGVHARDNATITLKKGLTVDQKDLGAAAAVCASGSTVTDGIVNGTGGTTYDIAGLLKAEYFVSGFALVGGTIDLHMGEHSVFAGYTTKDNNSTINLELSNGAQWANTDLSTTSSLSLLANSIISFNEIGTSDTFYNINSTSLMLAEGSILKVDLDDLFTGDITLFGDIANTDTWNGTVDAGNATLLNAAGTMQFIYTNPSAGVFRITGSVLVPEPTTASLTLVGLTGLMMRRRRLTA